MPPPTTNRLTLGSGDYSRGARTPSPPLTLLAGPSFHGSGIRSGSIAANSDTKVKYEKEKHLVLRCFLFDRKLFEEFFQRNIIELA